MRNTRERIIGIIGVCIDGLVIAGGLLIWTFIYLIRSSTGSSSLPIISFFGELVFFIAYILLLLVGISLVSIVLASVALIKLKNNPKLSGYLFLIAAGISGCVYIYLMIGTSMFLPIQAVAYLIAGILCLQKSHNQTSPWKVGEFKT